MGMIKAISLIHVRATMNLKANASQTFLSYFWWLLEPALYVALFYVVFEVLMLRGQPDFLFFLIVGKVPFLWVSKSLSSGANSIRVNKGLMGQMKLPLGILPYTNILESLYKQVVVFSVLAIFLFFSLELSPSRDWVALLPVIAVNLLFIIALALPLAWSAALIPDVSQLMPIITMGLMFTSGVFFDVNEISDANMRDALLTYQPLAFILDAYRDVILRDQVPDFHHLSVLAGVLFAFIVFWHFLYSKTHYLLVRRILHS